VERAFRNRANRRWLDSGVTLVDPATIFIDPDVTIGQDTIIWPNSYLQGNSTIGADCVIGPNTIVRNAQVGDGCRLEQTAVENCVLDDGTIVKPFEHVAGSK
jgi:bifunctional UDP-N-acetylglucosamine pyrophosphorylase / glucosamine-1-phosphate N-acetyltransferase